MATEIVLKLTFWALTVRRSLWRWANHRNVSFKTLYGGQFTLSTQLITQNYLPSYWINWFRLKSYHNLPVLSIYLPQTKDIVLYRKRFTSSWYQLHHQWLWWYLYLLCNVLISCVLHQWKRPNHTIAPLFIFV